MSWRHHKTTCENSETTHNGIQSNWSGLTSALQVVSYGISINLVEVTWKGRIKQQFPNPNDYSSFMGDFSSATGLTSGLSDSL